MQPLVQDIRLCLMAPPKPTNVSKPIVSKPVSTTGKPSFVPKSTGKPITSVPSGHKPKPQSSDDGWGDAQDVEERDFDEKPLEDVPSTYKPTKVNIEELRKQKSDTVSSAPKSRFNASQDKPEEESPKPLSERMKAYEHDDGRLTSLPKPKVGHSVADRYKANATPSGAPSFELSQHLVQPKMIEAIKLLAVCQEILEPRMVKHQHKFGLKREVSTRLLLQTKNRKQEMMKRSLSKATRLSWQASLKKRKY